MGNNAEVKSVDIELRQQHSVRPRATDVNGASRYTGMSRATLYAEMKAGNLNFVKLGGATRLEYGELDRWFDAKVKASAA